MNRRRSDSSPSKAVSEPTPAPDPFRFGWREVRQNDADGVKREVRQPLFARVRAEADGRLSLEEVGLSIGLREGKVVCWDMADGQEIGDMTAQLEARRAADAGKAAAEAAARTAAEAALAAAQERIRELEARLAAHPPSPPKSPPPT